MADIGSNFNNVQLDINNLGASPAPKNDPTITSDLQTGINKTAQDTGLSKDTIAPCFDDVTTDLQNGDVGQDQLQADFNKDVSNLNATLSDVSFESSSQVPIPDVGNNNPFDSPGFNPGAIIAAIVLLMQEIVTKAQQVKNDEQSSQIDSSINAAVAENAAGQADLRTMKNDLTAAQQEQIVNLATDVTAGALNLASAVNSAVQIGRTARVGSETDNTNTLEAETPSKTTSDEKTDAEKKETDNIVNFKKANEHSATKSKDFPDVSINEDSEKTGTSANSLETSANKNIESLKATNGKASDTENSSDSKMAQKQKMHDEQKEMHAQNQQNRIEDQQKSSADKQKNATESANSAKTNKIKQQHELIGSLITTLVSVNTATKNWEISAVQITQKSENIDQKNISVEEQFVKAIQDALSQRFQMMANSEDTMLQALQTLIPNLLDFLKTYNDTHSQQNQTAMGG